MFVVMLDLMGFKIAMKKARILPVALLGPGEGNATERMLTGNVQRVVSGT